MFKFFNRCGHPRTDAMGTTSLSLRSKTGRPTFFRSNVGITISTAAFSHGSEIRYLESQYPKSLPPFLAPALQGNEARPAKEKQIHGVFICKIPKKQIAG
jgi:hypothetical protein